MLSPVNRQGFSLGCFFFFTIDDFNWDKKHREHEIVSVHGIF